jgi:hypothetical protein
MAPDADLQVDLVWHLTSKKTENRIDAAERCQALAIKLWEAARAPPESACLQISIAERAGISLAADD